MDLKVTPEYVAQAAASCQSTASTIADQLSSLKQYVMGTEAWWGGIASETFQEMMSLYDSCSAALNQALTDIGSGLQGNYVNYTAAEQANVTSIRNIENELSTANLG